MRKTKEENRIAKELKRIEAEKNQKPVKSLTISIEWKKSRMWGSNPHASAEVHFQDGTFERREGYTAGGCGYDKTSTVVAEIFDDFLKYKLWGKLPTEKKYHINGEKRDRPYGVSFGDYPIGDGKENDVKIPYRQFSGGIGMSCFPAISEFIGGTFETVASGKSFDVYRYADNEA
jgi:hypothetical protein